MCTTHHLQKNYVHNLSLEKNYTHKLYFKQLCIQVVRINYAHIKLILKNYLTKFHISKLCIKVVYIRGRSAYLSLTYLGLSPLTQYYSFYQPSTISRISRTSSKL
jgi:hypothetical protein